MESRLSLSSAQACPAGRPVLATSRPAVGSARVNTRGRDSLVVTEAVKDVFMPALSSTMTEGKIVSWLKSPGDPVVKGEPLVVVESDKADMDVEAFDSGILGSIVIDEGGFAPVGEPIAYIAESEADMEACVAKAGGSSSANGAATAPAEEAAPAEAVEEVAAAPAHAEPAPVAAAAAAPAGAAAPAAAPAPPPPPPAPAGPKPRADGRVIATPYAKTVAKKLGVDLAKVGGTGPNGRITASDVERVAGVAPSTAPAAAPPVAAPAAAAPPTAPPAAPAAPVPDTTVAELRGTTVPLSSLEQAVARNMQEALKVKEFKVAMSICTDNLDKLYKELKPRGVTMSALLAKACGVALAPHPRLFGMCTPDGKGLTYNSHINIANAVAMPDGGLITPVLKDADTTDIYEMSRQWADLVKRARVKKLQPDEYSSGTFTLSNLGMMGVDSFDAVLPSGTAAILAVGASKPMVVATADGMFGVKKMMTVTLTADHRIVYGAHGAAFLQELKAVIENPEPLLR